MKSFWKKFLLVVVILFIAGLVVFLRVWYMPARDVQSEDAIAVTSKEIFTAYNSNEKTANAKYLNKAIQVTGEVVETKTNQQGKTTCLLKTDDPFFGINCTFRDNTAVKIGQQVALKGLCTGYMTGADVVMIDCSVAKAP